MHNARDMRFRVTLGPGGQVVVELGHGATDADLALLAAMLRVVEAARHAGPG